MTNATQTKQFILKATRGRSQFDDHRASFIVEASCLEDAIAEAIAVEGNLGCVDVRSMPKPAKKISGDLRDLHYMIAQCEREQAESDARDRARTLALAAGYVQ